MPREVTVYCPPIDLWPTRVVGLEELIVDSVDMHRGQAAQQNQVIARVRQGDEEPWGIWLRGAPGIIIDVMVSAGDLVGPRTALCRVLSETESLRQITTQHTWLGAAGDWAERVSKLAKREHEFRKKQRNNDGLSELPEGFFSAEELEVFRRFADHTQWFLQSYLKASIDYASRHRFLLKHDPETQAELLSALTELICSDWNRGLALLAWENDKDKILEGREKRSFRMFYRKRIELKLQSIITDSYRKRKGQRNNLDALGLDLAGEDNVLDTSLAELSLDQQMREECLKEGAGILAALDSFRLDAFMDECIKMAMKTHGEKNAAQLKRWMELSKSDLSVGQQIEQVVAEGLYATKAAAEKDRTRSKIRSVIKTLAVQLEFIKIGSQSSDLLEVMTAAVIYVLRTSGYKSISDEYVYNALRGEYGADGIVD